MARSAPSLRVFSCLPTVVYLQIVFPIEVQQVLPIHAWPIDVTIAMREKTLNFRENPYTQRSLDMSARERAYFSNYYHTISRPKTLANRAVAKATCQICGDEWANTQAGWNAEIFACDNCAGKLSNWDREKEMSRRQAEAACQVCYVDPAITIHESSQLRCCLTCSALLSEEEAEGSQRWKPANADPWDADVKLGHLFERVGAQFDLPPAVASLCGVKAPIWPRVGDMMTPAAVRRWGLCVACLQACPDPAGLAWRDRNYFAYVVPTPQEIAPAVGTS